MVRKVLLFAVLAVALPGAAFADSGNINQFNFSPPQSTLKFAGDFGFNNIFTPSINQGHTNNLFFSDLFNGGNVQFILNTNRGYFNGFTFAFGNSMVAAPEPGSLVFLVISLFALALVFRKKLKLQTSV
jgi:hypothetical protein